tara:strand:- start:72 stop:338 length:267 start_codon:yes stop_codon:yes gene_type:complete
MLIPLTQISFITAGRDYLQHTETELFLINPQHIITVESKSKTFKDHKTEEEITHNYSVILYGNSSGGGTKLVTESLFEIKTLTSGYTK